MKNKILSKLNSAKNYRYRFLFFIFFILLLLVIDIFAMQLYLPMNQKTVRQDFIDYMEQKGYHILIPHSMHLSVYGGVSFNDITILNNNYQNIVYISKITYKFKWPRLLWGNYKVDGMTFDGVVARDITALDIFRMLNNPVSSLSEITVKNLSFMNGSKVIAKDGSFQFINLKQKQSILFNISGQSYKIKINGDTDLLHSPAKLNFNFNVIYKQKKLLGHATTDIVFDKNDISTYHNVIKIHRVNGDERALLKIEEMKFSTHEILLNKINAVLQGGMYQVSINIPQVISKYWWQYLVYQPQVRYYSQNDHDNIWELYGECAFGDIRMSDCSTVSGCNLVSNFTNSQHEKIQHAFQGEIIYDALKEEINFDLQQTINNSVTAIKLNVKGIFERLSIKLKIIGDSFNFNLGKIGSYQDNFGNQNKLEWAFLESIDLEVDLQLKKVILLENNIKDFLLTYRLKNGVFNLTKFSGKWLKGIFNISGSGYATQSGLVNTNINGSLKNIDLASFMNLILGKTNVQGIGDFEFNVNYKKLAYYSNFYDDLSGSINLTASSILLPINAELVSLDKMVDKLNLNTKFEKGVSSNGLLEFRSKNMINTGACDIDLKHNNLDCKLLIKNRIYNMHLENHTKSDTLIIPARVYGGILSPNIRIQNMRLK